jgi:hypothetical protein
MCSSLGLTLKYNYALSMRAFLLKTGNDSMASGRYLNEYLAHIIRVYLKMRSTSQEYTSSIDRISNEKLFNRT